MSVGDYLKQAAAQLRRAAQAQQSESTDVRRSISNREQEVSKTVNDLQKQIALKRALSGSAPDDTTRALIQTEINRQQQEIRTVQNDFEQEKQRMNDVVKAMEQQQVDLNSQANNFERQASTS